MSDVDANTPSRPDFVPNDHCTSSGDLIVVNSLAVHMTLGASQWPRLRLESKLVPLVLFITVSHPLANVSVSDSLDELISYGLACKLFGAIAR